MRLFLKRWAQASTPGGGKRMPAVPIVNINMIAPEYVAMQHLIVSAMRQRHDKPKFIAEC
jgi:hypothetical protein